MTCTASRVTSFQAWLEDSLRPALDRVSIGKVLLAVLVGRLIEDDRLSLDAPLGAVLPANDLLRGISGSVGRATAAKVRIPGDQVLVGPKPAQIGLLPTAPTVLS